MEIFKRIKLLLLCLAGGFLVFSCSSLQEVNIEQSAISGEFLEIHSLFASLDGDFASGSGSSEAAENLVSMMDTELSDPGLLKAAAARVYALKGCTVLHLGRKSEARKMQELSISASKGDVYAIILSHRLDSSQTLDEDYVLSSDKAILVLEKALDYYAAKDYVQAVSRFDEAFLSLPDYYRGGYGKLRDESWNLRGASVSDSLDADENLQQLLSLKKITAAQMLLITEEDSNLLFKLTGGKNLSGKNLYNKAIAAGLFYAATQTPPASSENPTQQAGAKDARAISPENQKQSSAVLMDSIVNKFICARFLWNLYNENKSLNAKTKYSRRFTSLNRSPVADVPLSSPDFDAVLGCIENEFLNLEDGINFNGEKEISALEFSGSLSKLKN